MPKSPECRNWIGASAGILAALSFVAVYNEIDSSSRVVPNLTTENEAEHHSRREIVAQQVAAFAIERVIPERASRSRSVDTTTTTAATTTTTTLTTTSSVATTPIISTPPTTQANTVPAYPVGCELYRPLVAGYDWPVDQAMLVMSEESGCNPNKVSPTNDYGLMQLHNEPIFEPEANIRRGYEKWVAGRIGERNFSAWYAVCTRGNNPQPKYPGVICQ